MGRSKPAARCVAFLRGINLGKRRVKMDRLRELFEGLGFASVATYLASGNVLFESPASALPGLEGRIEGHLAASLGYEVDTFVRTAGEVVAAAEAQPFAVDGPEASAYGVHVGFLRDRPSPDVARTMMSLGTERDEFRIVGRELYRLCRGKVTDSLVSWPKVEKALGLPCTLRNIRTVDSLAAMLRSP